MWQPITQELINLLNQRPRLKSLLLQSIKKANRINSNTTPFSVNNISDYINYINSTANKLPGISTNENSIGKITKKDIHNGFLRFYFLIDQPLTELYGKGYPRPVIQYYPPFKDWLVRCIRDWGKYFDTNESWNDNIFQRLKKSGQFGFRKGWYCKTNIWSTWNEWFSRKLEDPLKSRPISEPNNSQVVVSPTDSIPKLYCLIDQDGCFQTGKNQVKLKMLTFHKIDDLLSPNSRYHGIFNGGTFTHLFLDVTDYHRYHYPVSGEVVENYRIQDSVSLNVKWDHQKSKYSIVENSGWQFRQTRSYVIIKTRDFGYVLVAPIGMAQVNSCEFTYPIYGHHNKGEELGYFLFGASDICIAFQKQVNFRQTAPHNKHILVGEEFGRLSKNT